MTVSVDNRWIDTHTGSKAAIFSSFLAEQPEVRASEGLLLLTGLHCQP